MVDPHLKIAIVDTDAARARVLSDGLQASASATVTWISETDGLLLRLYEMDPDVVIIDLQSPSRDSLEQMFQVSRAVRRPVAMFVDHSDRAMIEAAMDAGVSAYVVDGLKKERVQSVLDLAISRFNAMARLEAERDLAKSELEDRKIIDRAKGILMRQKKIDENAAYTLLRKTAMNKQTRMIDLARMIISTADLLES